MEIAEVTDNDGSQHRHLYKNTTTQAPPGMLLAFQESRSVGLRFYRKGLAGYSNIGEFTVTPKTRAWFNIKVDRVCPMDNYDSDAEVNIWNTAASSLALDAATAITDCEAIETYARQVFAEGYRKHYDEILLYPRHFPESLGISSSST